MSLTAWRQEEGCSDLHHLTDQQRTTVLVALKTLIDSIQAWGKQTRTVDKAAKKLRRSQALPKKLTKKLG